MNWQEKLQALNAVAECKILMRKPDDWYVGQSVEISSDDSSVLTGLYGNGATPQEAIENHWDVMTVQLKPEQYVVVNAMSDRRKHVRWNGFMWDILS